MKKLFSLVGISLALLLSTGCNKDKMLTKDLTGTWTVYKYLYRNVDETQQWLAQNAGYSITFTSGGQFTEKFASVHDTTINGVVYPDTTYSGLNSGTWAFANKYVNLVLTDSTKVLMDTVLVSTLRTRTYTIFDLTGSSVQFDTDTTQFYLVKQGY